MPYGLYLSADGAHAQAKRLEVIANNVANVDTIGFKRQLAMFQARYAEAVQQGAVSPGTGGLEDVGGGVMVSQTKTDFSAGPLKHTRSPTDLAIEGDGFFLVDKEGEVLLTRAGNFRLDSSGQLLTQQGYAVLSDAQSPIFIDPLGGPWDVSPAGVIRQQAGGVQSLGLARPRSPDDLERIGENLFRPIGEPEMLSAAERRVASGYLEMSDVRPTTEMVALIETSRVLEANMNMMKAQDQMLSGLVNRLLRV